MGKKSRSKPATGGLAGILGISHEELQHMLRAAPTPKAARARWRRAGIIDRNGKLAKKYQSWPKGYVPRTTPLGPFFEA